MAASKKNVPKITVQKKQGPLDPFRRAVLRGLAVLLPPLLTVVIFLWIANTVTNYLLEPIETAARRVLVTHYQNKTASAIPVDQLDELGQVAFAGERYQQTEDGRYMLAGDYGFVLSVLDTEPMPPSANEIYQVFVERKFLQPHIVIPFFLSVFVIVLYLLGKFLAAGIGRFFWMQFERVINQLPLVRNVYSSVKQVTDFMFSEREIEYNRVVAVEYPRKGIWTIAMVTGESLLDIRSAANEPVLSVLIPTSPMPFTGFTVTVKKSETVDLNLTIDQAFQFIVSCGVVVPPQQLTGDSPKGSVPAISAELNQ